MSYPKCLHCDEKTEHSTGLCMKCRTLICRYCGKSFMLKNAIDMAGAQSVCYKHRKMIAAAQKSGRDIDPEKLKR